MFKKIALLLMFVLPLSAFAQTTPKFGHVKSFEVIQLMPDYTKAMTDLQALQKQYTDEIKRASDEFQKKYAEFLQQQDSLPRNIAERRQNELQSLMERGQQFEAEAQQKMQEAQDQMTAPIFQKVEQAIKTVGDEGSFIYIFDLSRMPIPYVNDKQSVDVTPMVKTKLGIK